MNWTSIDRTRFDYSGRESVSTNHFRSIILGREGGLAPAPDQNEPAILFPPEHAVASPPSQPVIRPKGRVVARLVVGLFAVCMMAAIAPRAYGQQVVDQILTLVNDEVITRIDLLWSIAMDPKAPSPAGPVGSDLLSQKLDVMIDERLIAQEAARIPTTAITQDEIDKKRTELIKSFRNEAEFRQRVGSVGLTPQKIDELLRQRILIDRFVDFRFRSFVLVTEQEIRRHYEDVLAPQVRKEGLVPPPVDQVRDQIVTYLKQRKVDDEISRWIAAARQRADVVQLAEP